MLTPYPPPPSHLGSSNSLFNRWINQGGQEISSPIRVRGSCSWDGQASCLQLLLQSAWMPGNHRKLGQPTAAPCNSSQSEGPMTHLISPKPCPQLPTQPSSSEMRMASGLFPSFSQDPREILFSVHTADGMGIHAIYQPNWNTLGSR